MKSSKYGIAFWINITQNCSAPSSGEFKQKLVHSMRIQLNMVPHLRIPEGEDVTLNHMQGNKCRNLDLEPNIVTCR